MWVVYAIAIILGGGSLVVQLLGSLGHGGADHALDHGDHPDGPGVLSTRGLIYGLFTFGFVGGILHVLGLARPAVAFGLAVASAAAAVVAVGYTLSALGHADASGAAMLGEARGRQARVLVACARARRGKVRVDIKGQTVDMMASTDEEQIPAGATVVIVDVRGDVAHVAPTVTQEA